MRLTSEQRSTLSSSEEFLIKVVFEGEECWLYEPVRGVKFNLVQQAAIPRMTMV